MDTFLNKITIGFIIAVLLINGFNILQMQQMMSKNTAVYQNTLSSVVGSAADQGMKLQEQPLIDILPKGIPRIYGAELGVSYDDVSASNQQKADVTINKLGMLDQQIKLSASEKERYIAIASQISCEYCCGVESIIFKDGSAACGCQHSFAMRGLAKYLIENHPSEFPDEQILEELSKWKTLFFPAQMSKKAKVMEAKGIELNYINLASNKYKGLEN